MSCKMGQKMLRSWPGRWLSGLEWSIIPFTKKAAGSVPSQDTYLACEFTPSLVRTVRRQLTCLSVSLRLPPSLSPLLCL